MYLNVIQLAESFGVEENVVEGWVRHESLPAIKDRGRLLFDRAQVVEWAVGRGLAAKAGFLAPVRPTVSSARHLDSLLHVGGIWRDVAAADVIHVLEGVVDRLPGASPEVRRILAERLHAPDGITWAPVGHGFAFPHLRSSVTLGRDSGLLAILLLREPLPMAEASVDEIPVTDLLFFIAPSSRAHLEILAQLSSAVSRGKLSEALNQNAPDLTIYECLTANESPSPSPGDENSEVRK